MELERTSTFFEERLDCRFSFRYDLARPCLTRYYVVIMAWSFWYLFNSFQIPLPWDESRSGAVCPVCLSYECTGAALNLRSLLIRIDDYALSTGAVYRIFLGGDARMS